MGPLDQQGNMLNAIKATLIQLCKVGFSHKVELSIEGTIGVTLDKKDVLLLHFSDTVGACGDKTSSSKTLQNELPLQARLSDPRDKVESPLRETNLSSGHSDYSSGSLDDRNSETGDDFDNHSVDNVPRLVRHPATSASTSERSTPLKRKFSGDMSCIEIVPHHEDQAEDCEIMLGLDTLEQAKRRNTSQDDARDSDQEQEEDQRWQSDQDERTPIPSPPPVAATEEDVDSKKVVVLDDEDEDVKYEIDIRDAERVPASPQYQSTPEYRVPPMGSHLSSPTTSSHTWLPDYRSVSGVAAQVTNQLDFTPHNILPSPIPAGSNLDLRNINTVTNLMGKTVYQCPICFKPNMKLSQLEVHVVEVHGITEICGNRKIPHMDCEHCGKKFRYQASLNKHMFLHVTNRSFHCRQCNSSFLYEDSLRIHEGVHRDVFHCTPCGKGYSNKTLLNKHIQYKHEVRSTNRI